MSILKKIQSKLDFDMSELIDRLNIELDISGEKAKKFNYAFYDAVVKIIEQTHLDKLTEEMDSLIADVTKDFWHFDYGSKEQKERVVKSVTRGDTKFEYFDDSININKDIIISKYSDRIIRYRKLGW